MQTKKKVIIIVSMVLLLAVTTVVNVLLNKWDTTPIDKPNDDNNVPVSHFVNYRADRESIRNTDLAILDSIINSQETSAESKLSAEAMKLELCANMELEFTLESLIKAQGFDDAVVTLNSNNVNVVVSQEVLESAQVAQILSIIMRETNYTPDMVTVVPNA